MQVITYDLEIYINPSLSVANYDCIQLLELIKQIKQLTIANSKTKYSEWWMINKNWSKPLCHNLMEENKGFWWFRNVDMVSCQVVNNLGSVSNYHLSVMIEWTPQRWLKELPNFDSTGKYDWSFNDCITRELVCFLYDNNKECTNRKQLLTRW